MFDLQQATAPPVQPPAMERVEGGPGERIDLMPAQPASECSAGSGDEVVVCGHGDEAFRLKPLPPLPKGDGILSRPLRVQIAPGVAVGFLKNGGLGVRAEFGPGKKTGEDDN